MEIILSEREIEMLVKEIGSKISKHYAGHCPVLICVLKGGVIFTSDLIREITIPTEVDFIQASSYQDTTSTKKVIIKKDIDIDIKDRDVIIVDTIIDTGFTLNKVYQELVNRGPSSIVIATLLNKKCKREIVMPITYRGIDIDDIFVVGYGLDHRQALRGLPFIVNEKSLK
jgi:hypoxanthine phosphoribosyltransferase